MRCSKADDWNAKVVPCKHTVPLCLRVLQMMSTQLQANNFWPEARCGQTPHKRAVARSHVEEQKLLRNKHEAMPCAETDWNVTLSLCIYVQEHPGTSWNMQEHPGTCRNIQEHPGTFRNVQEHPGASRNILAFSKLSWCPGTYWICMSKSVHLSAASPIWMIPMIGPISAARVWWQERSCWPQVCPGVERRFQKQKWEERQRKIIKSSIIRTRKWPPGEKNPIEI